jgi:hypothetical protein
MIRTKTLVAGLLLLVATTASAASKKIYVRYKVRPASTALKTLAAPNAPLPHFPTSFQF